MVLVIHRSSDKLLGWEGNLAMTGPYRVVMYLESEKPAGMLACGLILVRAK